MIALSTVVRIAGDVAAGAVAFLLVNTTDQSANAFKTDLFRGTLEEVAATIIRIYLRVDAVIADQNMLRRAVFVGSVSVGIGVSVGVIVIVIDVVDIKINLIVDLNIFGGRVRIKQRVMSIIWSVFARRRIKLIKGVGSIDADGIVKEDSPRSETTLVVQAVGVVGAIAFVGGDAGGGA